MTRHLVQRGSDRALCGWSSGIVRGLGTGISLVAVRRSVSVRRRIVPFRQPNPVRQVGRRILRNVIAQVTADALAKHNLQIDVDYYSVLKARRVNSSEVFCMSCLNSYFLSSYSNEAMKIC